MKTSQKNTISQVQKVLSTLQKNISLVVLVALLTVLSSTAVLAWGPERPTFTIQVPATYVTFNSITNNPAHGDERNFVQIKEASASNTTYAEEVALQPGNEYEVYVYYHNNAASNYNTAEHNFKGIARDAQMRVQMPGTVKGGEKARITGIISASNAVPRQVWDEAYGAASSTVALRYVPNSAKIHNKGTVDGTVLASNLLTTGVNLGYSSLNGELPGCHEYAGYVTFRFKVDQANFTVEKQVAPTGTSEWADTVTVEPGASVDYRIIYTNTGTTQQNDVVIKDTLPEEMTYTNGSSKIANSVTNGQYAPVGNDDLVKESGINIGSYAPTGNAFVKFSAVAPQAEDILCGDTLVTNTGKVITNNGSDEDTANVIVRRECQPNECKPGIPVGDPRCEEPKKDNCPTPGKENLPKDDPNCVTKLPSTGPTLIASLTILIATTLGAMYWWKSRQDLHKSAIKMTTTTEDTTHLLPAHTASKPEDDTTFKHESK